MVAGRLSALFEWFAEDFGADRQGLLGFVRRYASPSAARWLGQRQEPPVRHLDYDWGINATRR